MVAQNLTERQALLVVFGDIDFATPKISGHTVYDYLASKSVWFVPRSPHGVEVGTPVLFYQSGVGFRGTASVGSIVPSSSTDRKNFGLIPLDLYPTKINLCDLRTFLEPIDPRPILQQISFISNKTYWGHSFRYSPRLIPMSDFNLITGQSLPDRWQPSEASES